MIPGLREQPGFYTELLNWKAKEDTGPMQYTEFQVGGTSVGGMMAMTPQHGDAPPHWLPYVMVKDCDATTAKAEKTGGRVLVPPMDIPKVGRGLAAVAAAPHKSGKRSRIAGGSGP